MKISKRLAFPFLQTVDYWIGIKKRSNIIFQVYIPRHKVLVETGWGSTSGAIIQLFPWMSDKKYKHGNKWKVGKNELWVKHDGKYYL